MKMVGGQRGWHIAPLFHEEGRLTSLTAQVWVEGRSGHIVFCGVGTRMSGPHVTHLLQETQQLAFSHSSGVGSENLIRATMEMIASFDIFSDPHKPPNEN